MASQRVDESRKHFQELMMPIFKELDQYDIPESKYKTIFDFAVQYYSINGHMKQSRVVKKIVEEFHLNKIQQDPPEAK